jgi:hypothetical protein
MNTQSFTFNNFSALAILILMVVGLEGCCGIQSTAMEPQINENAVLTSTVAVIELEDVEELAEFSPPEVENETSPRPEEKNQLINDDETQAQPTTNWNSYQNDKYWYSFMYPKDCYFGRMPSDCKEKPPEERRAECLCFLDSTDPDRVFLQAFLGSSDKLSLAQFIVAHPASPVFNPPQGTDLASWINKNFSDMFVDIPNEPNMDLNGIPAVRVNYPRSSQSPGVDIIYYLHNDLLFEIQLLSVDNEDNVELYDQMLSTFRFEK